MSDIDKINIYVPQQVGEILKKDAYLFEIFKSDGQSINMNRFLRMLILGYYNTYVHECQESRAAITEELHACGINGPKVDLLADAILKKTVLPEIPLRKGKNPTKLSLKPTNDTEQLIYTITNKDSNGEYISQYFCRMLMSYCQKPFPEREQIIFRENYVFLQDACKKKKPIAFSTLLSKKDVHTVIPYKLAYSQEEMFNYLLCAEYSDYTKKEEAHTYRLNRLSIMGYSDIGNAISPVVIDHLEQMLRLGPQYPINDDEEICVRLDEAGQNSFRRIYQGRPLVDRTEDRPDGHYYYFNCSTEQAFFYFRRFDNAEIVAPESLRQRMMDFHSNASMLYDSKFSYKR